VVSHSGQLTPGGYLSTLIHTTLAGIEPTSSQPPVRLLVRRATNCAADSPTFDLDLTKVI